MTEHQRPDHTKHLSHRVNLHLKWLLTNTVMVRIYANIYTHSERKKCLCVFSIANLYETPTAELKAGS